MGMAGRANWENQTRDQFGAVCFRLSCRLSKHNHPAVCRAFTAQTMDDNLLQRLWMSCAVSWFGIIHLPSVFLSNGRAWGWLISLQWCQAQETQWNRCDFSKMLKAIHQLLIMDDKLCFYRTNGQPTPTDYRRAISRSPVSAGTPSWTVSCDETQADFSHRWWRRQIWCCWHRYCHAWAMLLGKPMVVVYSLNKMTFWLAKRSGQSAVWHCLIFWQVEKSYQNCYKRRQPRQYWPCGTAITKVKNYKRK